MLAGRAVTAGRTADARPMREFLNHSGPRADPWAATPIRKDAPMKRFTSLTALTLALATAVAAPVSVAQAADGKQKLLRTTPKAQTTLRAQRATPQRGLKIGNRQGGAGQPDLVILPRYGGTNGLPQTGFCGPWNGGNQQVHFYVRNIGSAPMPSSVVQVNFGGNNYGNVAVPALAPNQQTLRTRSIPLAAWGSSQMHGNVQFLIAADHNDAMVEASEANNYGQSNCIGPAG